jgi:uncharacterized membrane protein
MNMQEPLMRLAISSVLALSGTALAADAVPAGTPREQCAGIIKAGLNDCATVTNDCHGHVTKDADRMAWIYVPTGTCSKLAGARLVMARDPSPAVSTK